MWLGMDKSWQEGAAIGFSMLWWKPLILHYSDQISLWIDQIARSEQKKGIKKYTNRIHGLGPPDIHCPHTQVLHLFSILYLKSHRSHGS